MLDVQNLCKSFDKKSFLTELTFQVAAGETLFVLGENGAGKTLLLNILATLVEPTSGSVTIDGMDAFSNLKQVRPLIGYIPIGFDGYPELSIVDYLNFFAAAYKLDKQERAAAIDAVLELMDIQQHRDIKIGILSTGERQRLLYAKTFLHEPMLWLIDEPLAALDPRGQIEMLELIGELKAIGKTIVITTHRLDDVERLAAVASEDNLLGILHDGQFAVFNTFTQLEQEIKNANRSESLPATWLIERYLEVTNRNG